MFESCIEKIKKTVIVPVVKLSDESIAVELAEALQAGGINAVEVTFRSADGDFTKIAACIKKIAQVCPDMLLGAGTVINPSLAELAVDSGAQFIVSPGFNPDTVDWCIKHSTPVIPGVNNPSLVEQALAKGLSFLKFFPAEVSGGVQMLKALAGPFPQVQFMATGGVNASNLAAYLACRNIGAIGGTWMAGEKLIEARDWNTVTQLSKEAIAIARAR